LNGGLRRFPPDAIAPDVVDRIDEIGLARHLLDRFAVELDHVFWPRFRVMSRHHVHPSGTLFRSARTGHAAAAWERLPSDRHSVTADVAKIGGRHMDDLTALIAQLDQPLRRDLHDVFQPAFRQRAITPIDVGADRQQQQDDVHAAFPDG